VSLKRTTVYFEKPGKENTEETLKIALEAARERGIDTVLVSSTTGWTALEALRVFDGSRIKLVVVTHQTGYRGPGVQMMPVETREKLEEAGVVVYTGTDVLTGSIDVGVSRQRPEKTDPLEARLPYIVPPVSTIVANTLRMFSQGVKVCAEIAMMAADAGLVAVDKSVITVAGSHSGADTAMVVTPSTSNRIRDMKFNEILAKPFL
jgi:hypothetical protein